MIKGFKTSEFYVVLIVFAPWLAAQFGIDVGVATDEATRLANAISGTAEGGNIPTWAAGAYVIGRTLLKWQRGQDIPAPKNPVPK